ncbi:MAG: tetratricopeptide repeat protein [Phycisphaeraceae bacterium]|nr:tetratricopeptide repeat protein [Phycisphaerales bacterium]MCB9860528.1 tetratricopeptide repeat protein [Phycisphaeraceae bacterium]
MAKKDAVQPDTSPEAPDRANDASSAFERLLGSWEIPAMVMSGLLLVGGLAYATLTAPSPDYRGMLDRAEQKIEQDAYTEALDELNNKVLPYAHKKSFGARNRARFHVLRARALYIGMREQGTGDEQQHKAILTEYRDAERYAGKLSARDRYFVGNTLISLEWFDRLPQLTETFGEDDTELQRELMRRGIRAAIDNSRTDDAYMLINLFGEDQKLEINDRAWSEARRAELLLASGLNDDALRHLLRWIPRADRASVDERGELQLLLGKAYKQKGDYPNALIQLERANTLLEAQGQLGSEALVQLAQVEESMGNTDSARDRYLHVTKHFPGSEQAIHAQLGLAMTEAGLHSDEAAVAAFEKLIALINERSQKTQTTSSMVTMEDVVTQLERVAQDRVEREEPSTALRFAMLARNAIGIENASLTLLELLARANYGEGEAVLNGAILENASPVDLADIAPETRESARRHLRAAGAHYRLAAERSVLSDPHLFIEMLWSAANAYNKAGDHPQALQALHDFLASAPDDPRRAEAEFRVAQMDQARGEYQLAANRYRSLIERARDPDLGKGVGPFAEQSYVPLAACLLLDTDASNDEDAELLLTDAVSGHRGDPTSKIYHDALIELGFFYYRLGRNADAVARLDEAMQRYPDDPRRTEVSFKLGDAARLDAEQINDKITIEAMPEELRQQFAAQRQERLLQGIEAFDRVIDTLEEKEWRRLTTMEQIYLRNAYFYRGDCAMALGQIERAIDMYVTARNRFRDDPASLVAFVQVFNAYLELGQLERARQTNNAAKAFLERIPDSAWDNPDLPMGITQWEQWLESSYRLLEMNRQAQAGSGE